ncbi:Ig-like domain-containing protein [Cohnella sp. AR92]|uniref:Ig-like domain-containing protein n=1 Tax=Cohnella sp. AR92 TaxID=648716 RepID=UPI00131557B4|nr:Ig-like domain-containing protein [Cohnella sp. AR92]
MKKIGVLFILATLLLTACQNGNKADDTSAAPAGSSASAQPVAANGSTVLDLKKKYGSEKAKAIMPMYNVPYDKVFKFKFNSKLSDLSPSDIISVHTDIKALEASKILTSASFDDYLADQTTIEVKPLGGVLVSSDTKKGLQTGWGNAPIYYIRINYDLDAATPTELDKPIIIPFTVKSDLPVPTVKKEISPDGRLKLVWNEVEGAKEYRIYQSARYTLLETTNKPLLGAEEGYAGHFPLLQATVTETNFDDFMDGAEGSLTVVKSDDPSLYDLVSQQNATVNGEYYVTAVGADGKESNFSAALSTTKLSKSLPLELENDSRISLSTFPSVADLPKTVKVKFIDGSIAERAVEYHTDGIQAAESGSTAINYTVKGTALRGYLMVEKATQQELDGLAASSVADPTNGYVEPSNDTDYVPAPDIPTIIDGQAETSSGDSSSSGSDDLVDRQKSNTEQQVESGDQEPIVVPTTLADMKVAADSAAEEYLALSMIGGQEEISLKAFPELQNFDTLSDTLLKVSYQNPLVLGLKQYKYNYRTLKLTVKYDYSKEDIAKKQQEIIAEAGKIVTGIIKPDMSDDDKRLAIYDYLNDNTKYDDEALENAEENDFKEIDPKFNDSFNTYGIMVNKVGVCASYAASYKMLSDLAGLDSIVVTGTMNGVPHAWNKVKLSTGWVNVDPTNNETNSGIPYLLYNSSDMTAADDDYALDNDYWTDSEIPQFASTDDSQDYYVKNGLEVQTVAELTDKLSSNLKGGTWTTVVRFVGVKDENALREGVGTTIAEVARDRLEKTKMGSIGTYVVIISE